MDKLFVNLKLPSYMYVYVGAPGYTLPTTRYTFPTTGYTFPTTGYTFLTLCTKM